MKATKFTIKIKKHKKIETINTMATNINEFKKHGIRVLENLDEKALTKMVKDSNLAFHSDVGEPLLSDAQYDILRDFIEKKYPKNEIVQKIGAEVLKNKAVLPYEMASMDKIKPDTNALKKWKLKYTGPYVITCKLDGVSGLYTTEGDTPKLYTRGDGKIGQDVSYLIPYLKLPKESGHVIRGEFIIKRAVFEQKYKTRFSNSRNLVAGIVNAKSVDDKIQDVDFVAYEVIRPENLTPYQQLRTLRTLNISTVESQVLKPSELTNEKLSEILQNWRTTSAYEIDGIIVSNDKVYPRTSGNPEHSFAFKMLLSDQIAETHVLDVEWNISKDGYLKPRVRVSEIELGGVKINYVTGINAAFIENNRIGVGAVVKIVRSGDVIPNIHSVTVPAENPQMPTTNVYRWTDTHVDIMLENTDASENLEMREKQTALFFRGIEVDGLGPGNVAKLAKSGYDTICKILAMDEADFMKVDGFQKKIAEKLVHGIAQKVREATLAKIMAVSNKFGRGVGMERIETILKEYPNVLDERNIEKLRAVRGIADKSAREFVENIPRFIEFLKDCGLEYKLLGESTAAAAPAPSLVQNQLHTPSLVQNQSHPLYGKSIVVTGFRDKDLETKLKTLGAKISSSVNKNTFVVVVKSMDESTVKIKDAKQLYIPIILVDEFRQKFGI